METTFNKDRRSIRSSVMVTDHIALELSTTWDKDRKWYLVTVARLFVNEGARTLSIMEDMQTLDHYVPVNKRYSAKELQELHTRKMKQIFNSDGTATRDGASWAKDSVIAAQELAKN